MPVGMLPIACDDWPTPVTPPAVRIPYLGDLSAAKTALSKMPDMEEYLAQFQGILGTAMAPVRQFIELIQNIMALVDCITAIPEAIMSLDPGKIFECLEKLFKAIAAIVAYVPPLPYIRTGLDIAGYAIDLIDAIMDIFKTLDDKISSYIDTWNDAVKYLDSALQADVDCALTETEALLQNLAPALAFIMPISNILMDVFTKLMPNPELERAAVEYKLAAAYNLTAFAALAAGATELPELPGFTPPTVSQHAKVPVPPLGPLIENLNKSRNAMILIYNTLAPLVGLDGNKRERSTPRTVNF